MADPSLDPSLDPNATGGSFLNPAYATPAQRAQLYLYANAMMAPQQINNGWQGLASIARALVGGYEGHQADLAEQASRMETARESPFGAIASPAGSGAAAATSPAPPPPIMPSQPSASPLAAAGVAANTGAATAPSSALDALKTGIANVEGNSYSATGPTTANGDRAYGRYQVMGENIGPWTKEVLGKSLSPTEFLQNHDAQEAVATAKLGGLLNKFGNPKDAASVWFTGKPLAQGADASDINGMTGSRYADLATRGIPGNGSPARVPTWQDVVADNAQGTANINARTAAPNGLPVNAHSIDMFMTNPNVDSETKRLAMGMIEPKIMADATGNSYISRQFQPPAQGSSPFFAGGAAGPVIAGVAPSYVGGTPGAPTQTIANPGFAGVNRGNNAGPTATPNLAGPGSVGGDIAAQQGLTAANIEAQKAKSAAAQQRYQQTQTAGPALMTQAYPLRQVQAILDKNGGNIPTGEGAEHVQGAASLINMISTALNHPLTNDESRLTSMELLHKYGTQVAASQAEALGLPHTNAGQEAATSVAPGTGLSQPADAHLVDNLIRLNAVAQKKNQFEHDYYLKNQGRPDAYDNFTQDWQGQISGAKAIPLSKFGRDVTMKNGKPGVWVPSTDPSGFSLFAKDDPAFDVSAMTPGSR